MSHWHRNAVLLLLVLVLAAGGWSRAVDVGEAEGSSSCPNVTTVSVHGSSNASVEITVASTCESSVVKATTSAGVRTLDLRHQDIAAVESLPVVNTVYAQGWVLVTRQ
jgi:hypothetical protein